MHPWIHLWGDVQLSAYFACIALGLSLATFVLRRQATRLGLKPRDAFDTALLVIPLGILGARLFLALDDPDLYLNNPWHFFSPRSGFVSYGAFAGLVAAVWASCRAKGLDPWTMLDAWAPAVMFGHAFARMGCLASGCCHGRPADWPLGVSVPWSVRYVNLGQAPEPLLVVPLHPSPLYEAALALAVFTWLAHPRRPRPFAGSTLGWMLVLYGSGRAILELFRGDLERGFYLGDWVTAGQISSAVAVAAGLWVLVMRRRACSPS